MKILTIGRDESCNIVLSDSTVSRRHAILKIHATGKMEIISMGQNGTFVNGVKLKSDTAYPVTRKDVVSFAHVRQLDWNQIPDVQRYYRYGIMAVMILPGFRLLNVSRRRRCFRKRRWHHRQR